MSRPGETDSGKGSFNRSTFKFRNHFNDIDFGHPKIFYARYNEYGNWDWFTDEGYYFGSDELLPQGPYNTWQLAHREMEEFLKK